MKERNDRSIKKLWKYLQKQRKLSLHVEVHQRVELCMPSQKIKQQPNIQIQDKLLQLSLEICQQSHDKSEKK
jgi:hypothetical protein